MPVNFDVQHGELIEYWWSYRWINIGKSWLPKCVVVLLWNDIVTSSGECSLLYEWYIDSKLFHTIRQWIETFNMVCWLNIDAVIVESVLGKPSFPNCVVLLWNDIVTSSGEFSLLYEWNIDSTWFYTMSWWIETFNLVCCLNIDEVIGESVLGNHHYQIVWFCYEMI